MSEKTKAKVLLAFLEYRAFYREPLFEAWGQHGTLVHALYRAFWEWDLRLENITAKESPANASEIQVNFHLPNWKAVFFLGIGSAGLVVTSPNWSEMELIVKIGRAGLTAILDTSEAQIDRQTVNLAMHLKPEGRPVVDLTSRFAHPETGKFLVATPKGFGFSVYGDQSSFVVDLSASYSDALFVRIARTFGSSIQLEQIAQELSSDEAKFLHILDLKLD
ncbi:MAG: hypothetical protein HY735_25970 [Verrucomicrobia bacterium]|nr:hypothetical protein [Verrucomicrobiota bacterium]